MVCHSSQLHAPIVGELAVRPQHCAHPVGLVVHGQQQTFLDPVALNLRASTMTLYQLSKGGIA